MTTIKFQNVPSPPKENLSHHPTTHTAIQAITDVISASPEVRAWKHKPWTGSAWFPDRRAMWPGTEQDPWSPGRKQMPPPLSLQMTTQPWPTSRFQPGETPHRGPSHVTFRPRPTEPGAGRCCIKPTDARSLLCSDRKQACQVWGTWGHLPEWHTAWH